MTLGDALKIGALGVLVALVLDACGASATPAPLEPASISTPTSPAQLEHIRTPLPTRTLRR